MNLFSINDLIATAPQMILLSGAILILVLQIVLPKYRLVTAYTLSLVATAAAIAVLIVGIPASWQSQGGAQILPAFSSPVSDTFAFHGHVVFNGYTAQFSLLLLGSLFLLLLHARRLLAEVNLEMVEIYLMMLFCTIGLLYFISAQDLVTLFVSLELASLALFVLAGWDRFSKSSNEAGIKYFLLSVLSTSFLLLGIAFLYGASNGKTNLNELHNILSRQPQTMRYPPYMFGVIGWICVYAAIAFKMAIVPFHGWVADVYEGSISFVTAFMASLIKIAAVGVLFKLVMYTAEGHRAVIQPVLAAFAVASMFYGNLGALVQTNLKRIFAYSSIAHAGYMATMFVFPIGSALMASAKKEAFAAVFFYVTSYALTSILVFIVIAFLETNDDKPLIISLDKIKGLSKRNPLAAFLLSLSALSFAGVPPLVGFFGKIYILRALAGSGQLVLALFVIINSLIAVFFYAKIVFYCYWDFEGEEQGLTKPAFRSVGAWVSGAALTIMVFGLGLVSAPIIEQALQTMAKLP